MSGEIKDYVQHVNICDMIKSVSLAVIAISFIAIAYSHVKSLEIQKVHATALIAFGLGSNPTAEILRFDTSKRLEEGFSIKEAYLRAYDAEGILLKHRGW